jgi:hypothetical protein
MCRSASIVLSRYVVLLVLFMRIAAVVYTYCEVIHVVLNPVKYSYLDDEYGTYLQIIVFVYVDVFLHLITIYTRDAQMFVGPQHETYSMSLFFHL